MNDLRLDEVHTAFLNQRFVSLAILQEGLPREVCFDSVFAQETDTQDRLCHLHHMEVTLSQVACDPLPDLTFFSVIMECSSVRTSALN